VIARQLRPAQLQPVERRFAGQRRTILATRRELAGEHRHRRVVTQLVMIDQIFIAQRNPKHALSDQRPDLMLDQIRRAAVGEAVRKPIDEPDRPVRRPQQQGSAIRGHPAAVKIRLPPRAPRRVQIQTDPRHTPSASGHLLALRQTVATTRFSQIEGPDAPTPFGEIRASSTDHRPMASPRDVAPNVPVYRSPSSSAWRCTFQRYCTPFQYHWPGSHIKVGDGDGASGGVSVSGGGGGLGARLAVDGGGADDVAAKG
jgi:hypothetical protein